MASISLGPGLSAFCILGEQSSKALATHHFSLLVSISQAPASPQNALSPVLHAHLCTPCLLFLSSIQGPGDQRAKRFPGCRSQGWGSQGCQGSWSIYFSALAEALEVSPKAPRVKDLWGGVWEEIAEFLKLLRMVQHPSCIQILLGIKCITCLGSPSNTWISPL